MLWSLTSTHTITLKSLTEVWAGQQYIQFAQVTRVKLIIWNIWFGKPVTKKLLLRRLVEMSHMMTIDLISVARKDRVCCRHPICGGQEHPPLGGGAGSVNLQKSGVLAEVEMVVTTRIR